MITERKAALTIVGAGYTCGNKKVSNDDLTSIFDTSDEWIRSKSGIKSRYYCSDISNSDIAYDACNKALKNNNHNIRAEDIDALIVATFTPDYATPTVANEVASRLGLRENVLSIDINGACSGFVYGIIMADGLLASGNFKNILVCGSEKISSSLSMRDRSVDVLFGDGAGAVVCTSKEEGFFASYQGVTFDKDVLFCERDKVGIKMQGQEVYRFALNKIPEVVNHLIDANDLELEDIDWFIFHQANERIISKASDRLSIPKEKVYVNIHEFGNTSAASIPIVIGEMWEKNLLKEGMTIMLVGFGSGLTFGGSIVKL